MAALVGEDLEAEAVAVAGSTMTGGLMIAEAVTTDMSPAAVADPAAAAGVLSARTVQSAGPRLSVGIGRRRSGTTPRPLGGSRLTPGQTWRRLHLVLAVATVDTMTVVVRAEGDMSLAVVMVGGMVRPLLRLRRHTMAHRQETITGTTTSTNLT